MSAALSRRARRQARVLPRPRHLLVRLPNPLGDAVLATPALRSLRAALPNVRITWAGSPAAQAALEGLTYRDGVVPLAGRRLRGVRAPFLAARLLRGLGADTALLLPNSFASALAVRQAGIRIRVGSTLKGRGLLITHPVALPLGDDEKLLPRPMTRMYLDLVAPFGAEDDRRPTELATTPFDEERAERRLARVPEEAVLVGVNPGASFGATKVYPPAHIGAAFRRVLLERDVVPVVLCGPGEEALAEQTAAAIGAGCLSTHDDVASLGELKALVRRLALLCTADAGPRHVAEAFGVPTVVWMGSTDPRWSEGRDATLVRNESLPCLGCHLKRCPIGTPCMERLEPELVADAILRRLASSGRYTPRP